MKTRAELIESLIQAHKKYLTSLDNLPVEHRQKYGDDSIKKYAEVMVKIEKNEMTDEEIESTISSIKVAEVSAKKVNGTVRGICSDMCLSMMYGIQVACSILIATKFPIPEASGLCSLIAEMIKRTHMDSHMLASTDMSDEEVYDLVHARVAKTIVSLTEIQQMLTSGKMPSHMSINMMSGWGGPPNSNLKN